MIKTAIQESRFLQIQTPFGNNKVFIQSISGGDGFSQLFEYSLMLLAEPGQTLPAKDIVGKRITVTLIGHKGDKRYINGVVNHFEYGGEDHEQAAYHATIVPWCWLLTNRVDCRIFQEKTTPEIIEDVFKNMGMSDYDKNFLQASYEKREYCVQYRESDWDFVCRLMEEEGIFYFFRHEAGKHTLVLADSKAAYFDLKDKELEYFPAGTSADYAQIHTWRHTYQLRSGKVTMTDYDFKKPSTSLMTDRPSNVGFEGMDKMEVYDFPGRYVSKQLGRQFAQVRVEELEAGHDCVKATSNYMAIATGGKFTIKRHRNSSEENQQYVVSRVYLQASADSYTSGGGGGPAFENEFECLPAKTVFRPRRTTRKPIVEGPQTAVVVGPSGEEIYVDEHSRVKVHFHWDRLGKRDQNSSCWVRVSQAHAGKGWGYIDIPRIGEEVIVSFLEGDPDSPIITGRVYNGENTPPFSLKGGDNSKNKTRRGNSTKTYKGSGFNEMSMDDTPGKEQIRVHAQYNIDSVIEHDETHKVGNDRTRLVGNNESITIGANQTIVIGKNRTTTIGQNDTLVVGSNQVVTIGQTQTIVVGAAKTEVVGGASTLAVGGAVIFAAASAMSTAVGEESEESVAGDKKVAVGGKHEVSVKKKYELSAGDEIELTCGASSIVMKKSGSIEIKGTNIKLQSGGGMIQIDTGGIITIKGPMVRINT